MDSNCTFVICHSTALHGHHRYDLIDEVAGVTYDRSHSLHLMAVFGDQEELLRYSIDLNIQCSPVLGPNGMVATSRVVGIKVEVTDISQSTQQSIEMQAQLISSTIQCIHSHLSTFRHLRVVELQSPLHLLRRAIELDPQLSQLPTRSPQLRYHWGCNVSEFRELRSGSDHIRYMHTSIDPATLQPSGTSKAFSVQNEHFYRTSRRT